MAAVTQNARPLFNINGSQREVYFYNVTIVTTGDTLFVPFRQVNEMNCNDTAITKMTAATSGFGSLITFTGTSANAIVSCAGQ